MITQEIVKEKFTYDPDTGVFLRKKSRNGTVNGFIDSHGYLGFGIDGKHYKVHRLAFMYLYGEFPAEDVDHINGNRQDNRIINLRAVSGRENGLNQRMNKNNTSGINGVTWKPGRNRWVSYVTYDGKRYTLGSFKDFDVAVELREFASRVCGFHENHGNKLNLIEVSS